jgi:hypothetical protein
MSGRWNRVAFAQQLGVLAIAVIRRVRPVRGGSRLVYCARVRDQDAMVAEDRLVAGEGVRDIRVATRFRGCGSDERIRSPSMAH